MPWRRGGQHYSNPASLNADGEDEVFLVSGNLYLSSCTGSFVSLFIRTASGGDWQMNLDFPTAGYTILPEGNAGFPDLQFGGMGWCEAVCRWNDSTAYQYHRNVPTAPDGCQGH